MLVTVTIRQHASIPYIGVKERQETYFRLYAFDYKKACYKANDFE